MAEKPLHDDDIRHDDYGYNPAIEPRKALAWLNLLLESETAFERWNGHCDNIDRLHASLQRLATEGRQKEFQLFWSNCEVIKPSIYAKAPKVVVVPKFKDRRPVYQAASEFLERCATVAFDLTRIDDLMKLIRDDLALIGRGVPWCRYESGQGDSYYSHEKVCIDFKDRRDFLHSVSRNWSEVTWVAAASYLTRAQARERFYKHSKDAYQDADYRVNRDAKEVGGADNRERAKFWEIWERGSRRVLWVAPGCEDILDEDKPHLDLRHFFPCPQPAYGTLQRGSLVPVPDVMQYKDQVDEVNLLTGRIHALSDALEAKGFYPAGGEETADAIETAVKTHATGRMLIPISNWAAFGGSKDIIIWLPMEAIAQTILALVTLRKQVIEDIYQIMGLSDIMRGATDARETLGAQQLKTQFGSTRIRDKQQEMVRVARDLGVIVCEILCQSFDDKTLIEMAQTELPTTAMQRQKIQTLLGQAPQMAQGNPQQAQQMLQQAQSQARTIADEPTIEQVLTFLRDNRARCFVLDIETDSTILIDENGEKQRRGEFIAVLTPLLAQISQMISAAPWTAGFCGDVLKFATAPFRAGRQLEGSIDELVESAEQHAGEQQKEDPAAAQGKIALQIEQMKLQRQTERDKQDLAAKQAELTQKHAEAQANIASREKIELAKLTSKGRDDEAKAGQINMKAIHDREKHQMDIMGKQADMEADARKMQMAEQVSIAKQGDMAARANERQAAQQFKQTNQIRQP